jgi:RNA polymerase sigma-70 factor (ECF subfamily)
VSARRPVTPVPGSPVHAPAMPRTVPAPVDGPDRAAFEELYTRRAGDALRYAAVIAGPARAADACREAWLRIRSAWAASDEARRDAWALRIVRDCARARRGWWRRRPSTPVEGVVDPSGLTIRLSPSLRETLFLREVADLSYAEIATVQGVAVGTVRARLHAARLELARAFAHSGR